VLLIGDDEGMLARLGQVLRQLVFEIADAPPPSSRCPCGTPWQQAHPDVAPVDLSVADMSAMQLLAALRPQDLATRVIIVTGQGTCPLAVGAMRLGAVDLADRPLIRDGSISVVGRAPALPSLHDGADAFAGPEVTLHASERWAVLVTKILDAPSDPRTLDAWARHVGASVATVKASCHAVGLLPRHSLILGRLLRALHLRNRLKTRVEDLLDFHDTRTFASWLSLAGISILDGDIDTFVALQQIATEPSLQIELRRALSRTCAVASKSVGR
jgi:hypothetical protein